ncbi:hypothetical protein NVA37_005338 [Escherichia coli]|nr:hypothetical protein [Escherichia coli]
MVGYDAIPTCPQEDEPEITRESLRWLMEGAHKKPCAGRCAATAEA